MAKDKLRLYVDPMAPDVRRWRERVGERRSAAARYL